MNLEAIQSALRTEGLDGWLFFDHHRRDPLAYRILGLDDRLQPTRRWYYFIPANGDPRGLVHRIESHTLDGLPGEMRQYSRWTEQLTEVRELLKGARKVALQYSPTCAIPYVSMVDAGTVELVRSSGVDVRTSADLVQLFEARWTDAQLESHVTCANRMDRLRAEAFDLIRSRLRDGVDVTEWDVRSHLLTRFGEQGLVTDHGPIVGVNANASDPHYEPNPARHTPIRQGDLVLIDLWARLDTHDSVFYDITWTGFCGLEPPSEIRHVFEIVTAARDAGIARIRAAFAHGQELRGFQVDDEVRSYIDRHGFGNYFIHRTGHSIGTNVHGAGANMDNFETHDERRVIPRTCFSIEPGIYLADFGIRSEVDVYVAEDGPRVTGEIQNDLVIVA